MTITERGGVRSQESGVRSRRGGALLAVLWLSAALAAISLSVANTVRGETERTSTDVDDARAYYLARGAVEGAALRMLGGPQSYTPGQPVITYEFPTGQVAVEIMPETAKLNINRATPQQLYQLLLSLGQNEEQASAIAGAIVDWRTAVVAPFGAPIPTFGPRHASFEEIEELLSVGGVTRDLFYGTYVRDSSVSPPQLVERGGLKDCLSVYGSMGTLDPNYATPAAMAAIGVPSDAIAAVLATRPFPSNAVFMQAVPGMTKLRVGGNSIFTLRATARPRNADGTLSDLRRTASALVKLQPPSGEPYIILRWYDRG